ncbi:MAG: GIY-YIG nuclease family protein [Rhodospirillales bacterium]
MKDWTTSGFVTATASNLSELPKEPGAYALLLRLKRAFSLDHPRFADFEPLAAGTYVYCGSAKGPGGLAARLSRHCRQTKKAHWHIDYLVAAAPVLAFRVVPAGDECALVAEALRQGATVPLPGFGSSDCRTCPAHLLRLA